MMGWAGGGVAEIAKAAMLWATFMWETIADRLRSWLVPLWCYRREDGR